MPNTYICVYRHFFPSPKNFRLTREQAPKRANLDLFLDSYSSNSSYYDWGDDPSFFSALNTQGSVSHAAWGVCRPNVRSHLRKDDVVIFFCAKQPQRRDVNYEYFFIGYGTVLETIPDRSTIWTKTKYKSYRKHHNILAAFQSGTAVQHETFYPKHEDWVHRLRSPYIIFDPLQSNFNLNNPLHVATSFGGKSEIWKSSTSVKVTRLEKILFKDRGIERRLRTSNNRAAHPHINITKHRVSGEILDVKYLREQLSKFL